MIFEADSLVVSKCIEKYKRSVVIWFPFLLVLLSCLFIDGLYYNTLFTWTIATFVGFIILRGYILNASYGIENINNIIKSIRISDGNIEITTCEIRYRPFYFGNSLIVNFEEKNAKFNISVKRFPYDKELTGNGYILSDGLDQYLICENFFPQFTVLKKILEDLANPETKVNANVEEKTL